ncbi:uncharacterized protein BJ212DRAFT_1305487 [Suillus subaureus]|uniref:SAP domain-containing protein n=1 Tax=Suillus subaureus TaxID=48587 RepID=A0A9P7J1X2_9AGAM|nr:uncharacterized protein BJ212DRAFT_1305487 [Suillus subaureus]KAG1799600.1 hypothetical protein BJ212DRAFT_1305487 [Suillus subaureus]
MVKGAARKKKEEVKEHAVARKAAQAAQQAAVQGAGAVACFTGSFSTKNKDDLIDIAGALQISTAGTKPELLKAIKEYFKSHPELKTNECFIVTFSHYLFGHEKLML